MKHFLALLLGLLFPPRCIGCGAHLPWAEPPAFCPTCYAKFPRWDTSRVLPPKHSPAITSFRAAGLYEGVLQHTILMFKFHDAPHLATPLARLLLPLLSSLSPHSSTPCTLVATPMHPSALRKRGYNQALLLAQSLGQLTGLPCPPNALKRLTKSDGQASRTRQQRLRLSSSDFAANPALVAGKPVILIDDIYTTGATAKACALALKKAGATNIYVITLAYTPPAHEHNPLGESPKIG